jgi:hypothetical protein
VLPGAASDQSQTAARQGRLGCPMASRCAGAGVSCSLAGPNAGRSGQAMSLLLRASPALYRAPEPEPRRRVVERQGPLGSDGDRIRGSVHTATSLARDMSWKRHVRARATVLTIANVVYCWQRNRWLLALPKPSPKPTLRERQFAECPPRDLAGG